MGSSKIVRAQVDADISDDIHYFDIANRWLLNATPVILPRLWRGLQAALPLEDPVPCEEHGSHGPRNSISCFLAIYHRLWQTPVHRMYSPESIDWFKEQLGSEPRPSRAVVGIEVFDDRGIANPDLKWTVSISTDDETPSWVRLNLECLPDSEDIDPHTKSVGRRWLEFMRESIQDLDISFGYIGDKVVRPSSPSDTFAHNEIRKNFDILYGCSWITIFSARVADQLGGFEYLTQTGDFFKVEELPSQGVLLQITEGLADFNQSTVQGVINALADRQRRSRYSKARSENRRLRTARKPHRLP
jgi:hypothetical protein